MGNADSRSENVEQGIGTGEFDLREYTYVPQGSGIVYNTISCGEAGCCRDCPEESEVFWGAPESRL